MPTELFNENTPGPGRPKGSPNKITRQIKEIIQQIADCSSEEEVKEAVAKLWAKDPRTMMSFLGRVAPKSLEVSTPPGRSIEFNFGKDKDSDSTSV